MNLPALPYHSWSETRQALHLILQIIGKIKIGPMPKKNHWWNITQHISTIGFSSYPVPMGDDINTFEINLNIHSKCVEITTSLGEQFSIDLSGTISIQKFYQDIMKIMNQLNIKTKFVPKPYDMGIDTPFEKMNDLMTLDWESIDKFWKILLWCDGIFQEFSGRFYGKSCPVHLYWHHMDLTVTRFSGKEAREYASEYTKVGQEAYSHEEISFGFWAGDENIQQPAFYSYTYPSPKNLNKEELLPKEAQWIGSDESPMALLTYEDVLNLENPKQAVLDFLESAYQAGAKLADWDIAHLTV